MDWAARRSFVSLLSLHSGNTLVCYPFGSSLDGLSTYQATPDDDLFIKMATDYAALNPHIASESSFPDGITNGAAWYAVTGELADWVYRTGGTMALTAELCDEKTPPADDIEDHWLYNKDALTDFVERAQTGVTGTVVDAQTGYPLHAIVTPVGRDQSVESDPRTGAFQRMLPAGEHVLDVRSPGYRTRTFEVHVDDGLTTTAKYALSPTPHTVTRRFNEDYYVPGDNLTVSHTVRLAGQTEAMIVQATLPTDWTYLAASTREEGRGPSPGEPRIEGQTCSWLLWADSLADGEFSATWHIPTGADGPVGLNGGVQTTDGHTQVIGKTRLRESPRTESGFHLYRGWNLVSLDLVPDTPKTHELLAGTGVTPRMWRWNGLGYEIAHTLEPGVGYWVYTKQGSTVRYSGTAPVAPQRTVSTGWHLIGTVRDRDAFLGHDEVTGVVGWSARGYGELHALKRGRAAWVYTTDEATLPLD